MLSGQSLVAAVAAWSLTGTAVAVPAPQKDAPPVSSPPNFFTLTAYNPDDVTYNGLKANYGGGLNLYQEKVASYCPTDVQNSGGCPNGTETVFGSGLRPDSEVPGGQDSYVEASGRIRITIQHSHSIPPDATWGYVGFTYKPIAPLNGNLPSCPCEDPLYNCESPTGYYTWQPTGQTGGIRACPDGTDGKLSALYAVTPGFNRTDCVALTGLGTHDYAGKGPNPPVWSYI